MKLQNILTLLTEQFYDSIPLNYRNIFLKSVNLRSAWVFTLLLC